VPSNNVVKSFLLYSTGFYFNTISFRIVLFVQETRVVAVSFYVCCDKPAVASVLKGPMFPLSWCKFCSGAWSIFSLLCLEKGVDMLTESCILSSKSSWILDHPLDLRLKF
jgi:hypothetical protein